MNITNDQARAGSWGRYLVCSRLIWRQWPIWLAFLYCMVWAACGQETQSSQFTSPESCAAGVVIETITSGSAAEKAGLAAGDKILAWEQAGRREEIASPFAWLSAETEAAPRGAVVVDGMRGSEPRQWTIPWDSWGIEIRPQLPDNLLPLYSESEKLAGNKRAADAASRLRKVAESNAVCAPVRAWMWMRAGEVLEDAKLNREANGLFDRSLSEAPAGRNLLRAQLLRLWAGKVLAEGDGGGAAKFYQQALEALPEETAQTLEAAKDLAGLGRSAEDRGDPSSAEQFWRKAIAIQESLAPESLTFAVSLNYLGNLLDDRRQLDAAWQAHQRALAIREKLVPGSMLVAASLSNLGEVAYHRNDLDKSEEYGNQALAIREKLAQGTVAVAISLDNLGLVAQAKGETAKAEDDYRRALEIDEKLSPGSDGVASDLNNLGVLLTDRGDLAQAEKYLDRALEIWEKIDPGGIGVANDLNNLGDIVSDRGDQEEALKDYLRALAIFEKIAPKSTEVGAYLQNIGSAYEELGNLDEARNYLLRSLEVRKAAEPGGGIAAVSLSVLGDILTRRNELKEAEADLQQAIDILEKESPGSLVTADAYHYLGNLAYKRGQLAQAETYYRQGLEIRKRLIPESLSCAESLSALGRVLRSEGKLVAAEESYSQAINVYENQITRLGGYDEIRAGFRAEHLDFYREYVDLLVAQGKKETAFEVLERSRAQTMLETLRLAQADLTQGADRSLLEEANALRDSIRAAAQRRIAAESDGQGSKQAAATGDLDQLLARYRQVQEKLRAASPKYAALTQPQTLTTSEVQRQVLDPDSLLLEYSLGDKRSYLFALSATGISVYDLPPASAVDAAARRFYRLLTSPNRFVAGESGAQRTARKAGEQREYDRLASTLSTMLLGPVAAQLEQKRLLIVCDGALQYIPFSALPLPGSSPESAALAPLITSHEVVNLPSASALAMLRQEVAQRKSDPPQTVAVLADPVFDKNDARVRASATPRKSASVSAASHFAGDSGQLSRSIEDTGLSFKAPLPRLAFSRQEAASILSLTPKGQGMEALDFQASRDLAASPELARYRIVHFATHGLMDSRHPELSGLVFSLVDKQGNPRNGFLGLEDIYNLNLPVHMVVLSACQTALGKEISGEGLVGLTRGFMYAGAPSVVASLWKVNDAATAAWMAEFYRGILEEKLSPSAALRQAQLALWKQKRWSNPYDWAAFTLQGEWR